MKKYALGSLAIWMVVLITGLGATFAFNWSPVLGLDLQGGLSTTLVPKDGTNPPEESVSEAAKIIRERVDGLGIAEPDVVRSGKTVVVQLPGLKSKADQERAKEIIGTTAKLQFHQVLTDLGPATPTATPTPSAPATTAPAATSVPTSTPAPATTTPSDTNENSMGVGPERSAGVDPIAYHAPTATTTPPTTTPPTTTPPTTAGGPTTTLSIEDQLEAFMAQHPGSKIYTGDGNRYVLGPALFDGTVLSGADAQLNQKGEWEVNVKIKDGDKDEVNDAFNECFAGKETCPPIRQGDPQSGGKPVGAMAMVLDGEVISAPSVNQPDLPKNPNGFVITGNFTKESADSLALQLRYGALPVEFQPATMETVSATLGANSLDAALVAGLIGLILVAIYLLAFYKLLGVIAILSLASSTAMVWIVICYMGANNGLALTLAGITGIIVSIGIAVDSNVVFYEHLREDMSKGRSLRETVRPSFKTAWGTIVNADFVSIMGAVILYMLTIGPVRGFAFYLGLSTFVDLLASWFFMRPLAFWLADRKIFNRRPGLLGVKPFDVDPDAIVAGKTPKKATEAMA